MFKYLKYLKSLLYIVIPLLILNIIISVLYYFDLLSSNAFNISRLSILLLSVLIGGFNIGKSSKEKGYIEGLKLGILIIVFMFIFSLILKSSFSISKFLYYIVIIIVSILGSMIGINKRKNS